MGFNSSSNRIILTMKTLILAALIAIGTIDGTICEAKKGKNSVKLMTVDNKYYLVYYNDGTPTSYETTMSDSRTFSVWATSLGYVVGC